MKTPVILLTATLALLGSSVAEFSKAQLERESKQASKKRVLLAFFFEQAADRANSKTSANIDATNKTLQKAVPRRSANMIVIKAGETGGIEILPDCVKKARTGAAAQLIVTNADVTSVLLTLEGQPDQKQVKEFKEKAEAEAAKQYPTVLMGG